MPTLPVVVAKKEFPVEVKVVNAPDPWVVTPIVVKLPAAGVVVPMAPGVTQVAPTKLDALIVPVEAYVKDEPVLTVMAAGWVLVPVVILAKLTVVPEGKPE
ncbi:MAG TPA: hypothetical protein VMR19_03585, partial [Candidatus Saccharimonadales bacterium]|nr:hypothetical protein [Candidatus Saccharimonadales bacterium]